MPPDAAPLKSSKGDHVFTLPVISAPAHEWPTLNTTPDQLCKLNDLVSSDDRKLAVTFDIDIYKRTLKLQNMQHTYKEQLVLCPGVFHTSICALRCLGKTIEGSGFDEAWMEADLYGSVTKNEIINGNHYGRALQAHEITLQVLNDLWLEAFFKERPVVRDALKSSVIQLSEACFSREGVRDAHTKLMVTLESLNLSKQLASFDQQHSANPMFQWARQYMRQVISLLQFQRATRQGDWLLHLASLESLCMYFFAYNRHDYAQNIPEYIARIN